MDAMQNQAMAAAIETRRRVQAVNAALARIDTGEFGFCESCGGSIPFVRLALDPTYSRCVGCRA